MLTRATTLAALALTLFSTGWWHGSSAERDRWSARAAALTAERDRAAARVAGLTEALETERAARAAAATQLEDDADADADSGRIALPARSLRRLDAR